MTHEPSASTGPPAANPALADRPAAGEPAARRDHYHHGDLRRALLAAALDLLAEQGLAGLGLRAVARRAGVSHGAPYHHFADKAALIEALVETCFEQFAAALRAGPATGNGDSPGGLIGMGIAYVRFAHAHPAAFRLMFRPELYCHEDAAGSPTLAAVTPASRDAYQVLLDGIAAGQASGTIVAGDRTVLALTAWSTVHGLAVLLTDGPEAAAGRDAAAVTALAQAVTTRLVEGLRPRPVRPPEPAGGGDAPRRDPGDPGVNPRAELAKPAEAG